MVFEVLKGRDVLAIYGLDGVYRIGVRVVLEMIVGRRWTHQLAGSILWESQLLDVRSMSVQIIIIHLQFSDVCCINIRRVQIRLHVHQYFIEPVLQPSDL